MDGVPIPDALRADVEMACVDMAIVTDITHFEVSVMQVSATVIVELGKDGGGEVTFYATKSPILGTWWRRVDGVSQRGEIEIIDPEQSAHLAACALIAALVHKTYR